MKLMNMRAQGYGLELIPPLFPDSLNDFVRRNDPASAPYDQNSSNNPFLGKKILVLSGKDDPLVPWTASQEFVERLEVGSTGVKACLVEEGAGHWITTKMEEEAARFIWDYCITRSVVSRL
jgi:hypothetical protein